MASFFDQAPTFNDRPNPNIRDLILMGGEQRARAAQMAGQNWANAIQGVGNAVSGGIQAYQADKAEKKQQEQMRARDAATSEAIATYDPSKPQDLIGRLVQIRGPKEGTQMAETILKFSKNATDDNPETHLKATHAALGMFLKESPELQAATWGQFKAGLQPTIAKLGLPVQLPDEYSPDVAQMLTPAHEALGEVTGAKAAKAAEVGGLEDFITRKYGPNPTADQIIEARNTFTPPKVEKGPQLGSFEDFVSKKYGPNADAAQITAARKEYAAADNAPKGPASLTPTAESNIVDKLSRQWTKANATAQTLDRNVTLMDQGLEAARKGDLAAGSQAVLVTFQKILDPTSVVRESEYARSAEGQSLMAQLEGKYEQLAKGGAGVPLVELEKYADLAKKMAAATKGSIEGTRKRISATAKRYNIPDELVMEDFGSSAAPTTAPATKTVVKRGKDAKGRAVVLYSDGSSEFVK